MGKSFFTGTDAQLATGSAAFSAKITATPTTYGLTEPLATAYAALDATWQAAYLAANDPEQRTRAKVIAKNEAAAAVRAQAAILAKLIDGTASVTNEQRAELGLSVRKTPGPVGAPGTSTGFVATFVGDGAITLKWRCSHPPGCHGVMYQVYRRVGTGEFAYLGGVGEKKFVDNTLPMGASNITYKVQAVRSSAAGDWAQFNLDFGTTPSEPVVSEMAPVKIAA